MSLNASSIMRVQGKLRREVSVWRGSEQSCPIASYRKKGYDKVLGWISEELWLGVFNSNCRIFSKHMPLYAKPLSTLWTGLVILIWKLFSMSGYRKYINCIWFWHRNPNFGLKKSLKAKKGHKGQWRPAKAKKVQNSKNL